MKISFLIILTVSAVLSFNALADVPSCGENCTYEMSANGTDLNGETTYKLVVKPIDDTLPAYMQKYSRYGYPQTGTNYAPWRFDNVTEVVVESGIENISYGAFTSQAIKTVTLPEGLKTLGPLALYDTKITEIKLPDTLTTIGEWGLMCPLLEKLEIPSSVRSIERYALSGIQLSDLVIPPSVNTISPEAFGTSTKLNKLYCEEAIASQCAAAINNTKKDVELKTYQKYGDAYYSDGKFYASPKDIGLDNHIKKRIYTVDEANKISGKKNSLKIRYK